MSTTAKVVLSVLIFLLPYILVALCWCASFDAFEYKTVVTHEVFYFCSVVYWIIFQWILQHAIWEE